MAAAKADDASAASKNIVHVFLIRSYSRKYICATRTKAGLGLCSSTRVLLLKRRVGVKGGSPNSPDSRHHSGAQEVGGVSFSQKINT